MTLDDKLLERHLRTFRPRAPQPLPVVAMPSNRSVMIIAVPVLAVLLVCASVLLVRPPKQVITLPLIPSADTAPENLAQWNALERAHQFDDALTFSARKSLPRTDAPNSALHTLAKD